MRRGGEREARARSGPAVKLDLLVAALFALVWKTAGSRLSICGEHLFLCAGRRGQREKPSSAGPGTGMSDSDEYNV